MLNRAAKLQVYLHSWILMHRNEYLGNHTFIKYIWTDQWRITRPGLGIFYCLDGIFHSLRLDF